MQRDSPQYIVEAINPHDGGSPHKISDRGKRNRGRTVQEEKHNRITELSEQLDTALATQGIGMNRNKRDSQLQSQPIRFLRSPASACPVCRATAATETGHPCNTCKGQGHLVDTNPYLLFKDSPWLSALLSAVVKTSEAEFGNIQLLDMSRHSLRIAAQRGFKPEFLTYFDAVSVDHFACGSAMKKRARIVVTDVDSDPLFQNESKPIMLRANVRSCQSTPLIFPSGKLIGIVSTHFNRPRDFSPTLLKRIDEVTADFLRKIEAA